MNVFSTTRHWFTPLSLLFLSGLIAPFVTANPPETEPSPEVIEFNRDDQGGLHLHVNDTLAQNSSENLDQTLIRKLYNDQESQPQKPIVADSNGNIHYLAKVDKDSTGHQLHLIPIHANTPLSEISSRLATSFTTLIILNVADRLYRYYNGGAPLSFAPNSDHGVIHSFALDYANMASLASAFTHSDALTLAGQTVLSKSDSAERTTWKDVLPPMASAMATGGFYWGTQTQTDALHLGKLINNYHLGATTAALATSLRKLNEATVNSLTDLNPNHVKHIGRFAALTESTALLALISKTLDIDPTVNDPTKEWFKSALPCSVTTTMIFSLRDLVSEFTGDLIGNPTFGEFLTASGFTAAAYLLAPYKKNISSTAAETAGLSIGFGVQKLVNSMMQNENANSTRAARLTSAAALSFAMKTAALYVGPMGANLLNPMATGVIIANTFDVLAVVKDVVFQPWVINPLLKLAGMQSPAPAPAPAPQ